MINSESQSNVQRCSWLSSTHQRQDQV